MRFFLILFLAGFFYLPFQNGGFAATSTATTMPEVEVRAGKGKASLTAGKASAAQNLARTVGGTSLIDAESYMTGRASTLQDALGYAPGVFVQPRFGSDEARLSIRGSGIQRTFHLRGIKLLQDGVPINQADGAGDFQAIEPLALDYIEVYRGANALQYGSTTLGGAINFVSPTGYTAPLVQGRFEYGGFGYMRDQVSSGYAKGPLDYFISLSEVRQDGYRNHAEQWNKRLFSNYGVRWNDAAETRFYLSLVDSKSKLPGNLTAAQFESNPKQAAAANVTGNQKRDFDLVRLATKTVFQGNGQMFELGAFWIRKDLFHPIFQVINQISDDVGASFRYQNENELFDHKNIFTFGFNPTFGAAEDLRYTNVGGRAGTKTAESKLKSYNLDFFAEEQFYALEKLALVGGLQWSVASRRANDKFLTDGDHSGRPLYHGWSPKVGLRYEFTETSQAFANFSRSFEPPSFGELTNVTGGGIRSLKEQNASTIEVGTRGQEWRLSWDAAWYYSWVDNELLGLNDGAGNPLGTINASETTHHGIELGVGLDVLRELLTKADQEKETEGDKVVLRSIYNWSRFRFDDDRVYRDNALPGIPEHFFRGELNYEHPCGFYFGPNVEWVLKQYAVDMANSLEANNYILLGLKGGFKMKRGISVFIEAKNLTDKHYVATTGVIADARGRDSAQFLPGDGRTVISGIEFKW